MKRFKLVILLIIVVLVFNINISYGRENKNSIQTTQIIIVKKDNLLAVIEDSRSQQNQSNVIDKGNSSTDNDSKYTKVSDFKAQKFEVLNDNTITIPNVCDNAIIAVGSTQADVDKYDICIMTEAVSIFGNGKPILLGGHNTKSLKYLYKSCVDDIITVYYENGYYKYKIIYSNECTNDGQKLYDIDTNINMLDYNLDQEILYIYTCYNNNNWLVKAIRI